MTHLHFQWPYRMCLVNVVILTIVLFVTGSSKLYAASFDCAKAATDVEYLICGNSVLSELDSTMASKYKKIRRTNRGILENQRNWLRKERNICRSSECLANAYNSRIKYFDSYSPNTKEIEIQKDVNIETGELSFESIRTEMATQWDNASYEEKLIMCYSYYEVKPVMNNIEVRLMDKETREAIEAMVAALSDKCD